MQEKDRLAQSSMPNKSLKVYLLRTAPETTRAIRSYMR